MKSLWWNLPGPTRFLTHMVEDLRDGKNVVLYLPEHCPDGLLATLLRIVRDDGAWGWEHYSWSPTHGRALVHDLIEHFVPAPDPSMFWNANFLAQNEAFAGRLVVVDRVDSEAWPAWQEFVVDYAHACRVRPAHERSLFVILVEGEPYRAGMEDVCLSQHRWYGCVDRMDTLLYSSSLMTSNAMTPVQRQTALAIIANLALWDPEVVAVLIDEDLTTLLRPQPILRRLAQSRGWHRLSARHHTCERGIIGRLKDDDEKVHSAMLALTDLDREIDRRIWSAQIGVLFPYIEEQRFQLLSKYGRYFHVPYQTRFGVIDDVRDLEIGHIESQIITYHIPVSERTLQQIRRLRAIRNQLSHLEPLSPELLVV